LHSPTTIVPTTAALGHPGRLLVRDVFIFLFDKKSVIDLMLEVVDVFCQFLSEAESFHDYILIKLNITLKSMASRYCPLNLLR